MDPSESATNASSDHAVDDESSRWDAFAKNAAQSDKSTYLEVRGYLEVLNARGTAPWLGFARRFASQPNISREENRKPPVPRFSRAASERLPSFDRIRSDSQQAAVTRKSSGSLEQQRTSERRMTVAKNSHATEAATNQRKAIDEVKQSKVPFRERGVDIGTASQKEEPLRKELKAKSPPLKSTKAAIITKPSAKTYNLKQAAIGNKPKDVHQPFMPLKSTSIIPKEEPKKKSQVSKKLTAILSKKNAVDALSAKSSKVVSTTLKKTSLSGRIEKAESMEKKDVELQRKIDLNEENMANVIGDIINTIGIIEADIYVRGECNETQQMIFEILKKGCDNAREDLSGQVNLEALSKISDDLDDLLNQALEKVNEAFPAMIAEKFRSSLCEIKNRLSIVEATEEAKSHNLPTSLEAELRMKRSPNKAQSETSLQKGVEEKQMPLSKITVQLPPLANRTLPEKDLLRDDEKKSFTSTKPHDRDDDLPRERIGQDPNNLIMKSFEFQATGKEVAVRMQVAAEKIVFTREPEKQLPLLNFTKAHEQTPPQSVFPQRRANMLSGQESTLSQKGSSVSSEQSSIPKKKVSTKSKNSPSTKATSNLTKAEQVKQSSAKRKSLTGRDANQFNLRQLSSRSSRDTTKSSSFSTLKKPPTSPPKKTGLFPRALTTKRIADGKKVTHGRSVKEPLALLMSIEEFLEAEEAEIPAAQVHQQEISENVEKVDKNSYLMSEFSGTGIEKLKGPSGDTTTTRSEVLQKPKEHETSTGIMREKKLSLDSLFPNITRGTAPDVPPLGPCMRECLPYTFQKPLIVTHHRIPARNVIVVPEESSKRVPEERSEGIKAKPSHKSKKVTKKGAERDRHKKIRSSDKHPRKRIFSPCWLSNCLLPMPDETSRENF